uniref:Uncharacterized protein n=1 Tax=Arundo donax TaxID=35708 RepID=A0A0A8ZT22_ARUDO
MVMLSFQPTSEPAHCPRYFGQPEHNISSSHCCQCSNGSGCPRWWP